MTTQRYTAIPRLIRNQLNTVIVLPLKDFIQLNHRGEWRFIRLEYH